MFYMECGYQKTHFRLTDQIVALLKIPVHCQKASPFFKLENRPARS